MSGTDATSSTLVLKRRPRARLRGTAAALLATLGCSAAIASIPGGKEGWVGRELTIRLTEPIPFAALEGAPAFTLDPLATTPAPPFRMGALAVTDAARAQLCLTSAIYYESASESEDGQRAVAQVVLNRIRHPAYPNSVCGVVFEGSERDTGCQFTFTCDGAMMRAPSRSGWATASRLAREALAGAVYAPVGTATHYHTLAVAPPWSRSMTTTAIVGAHIFFRLPGAAGEAGAFRQAYAMREPVPGPYPRQAVAAAPVPLPGVLTLAPMPGDPAALPQAQIAQAPVTRDIRPEYAGSGTPLAPYRDSVADSQIREEWRDSGTWIAR